MGKFSKYAKETDAKAREAFAAYMSAEEQLNKYSGRSSGDVYSEARKTQAKAALDVAKAEMRQAQRDFKESVRAFEPIRRELSAAVSAEFMADPKQIDNATLELLKSGILTADEYVNLFEKAQADSNHTLARLIGKYANDVVEAHGDRYGDSDPSIKILRWVVSECNRNGGDEYLSAFDGVMEVFRRCTNNPALIPHWDELTSRTLESF